MVWKNGTYIITKSILIERATAITKYLLENILSSKSEYRSDLHSKTCINWDMIKVAKVIVLHNSRFKP